MDSKQVPPRRNSHANSSLNPFGTAETLDFKCRTTLKIRKECFLLYASVFAIYYHPVIIQKIVREFLSDILLLNTLENKPLSPIIRLRII